jgi:hypothetical protein
MSFMDSYGHRISRAMTATAAATAMVTGEQQRSMTVTATATAMMERERA